MNEWAEIFDCPVYIHKNDEEHIMIRGEYIQLWSGDETDLWDGMKLICIGGHFAGSSILHVPFLSKKEPLFVATLCFFLQVKSISQLYIAHPIEFHCRWLKSEE